MRFCGKPSHYKQAEVLSSPATLAAERAFALMGVMVVVGLLMILVVSGFSAILSMKIKSNPLAEDTAAMAAVEAKVQTDVNRYSGGQQ